jgi:glycine cleavage system H protein
MEIDSLKFTKTHEWLRLEGNRATDGITDHAQHEITDVVFVELPTIGKKVAQGGEVAVVESVKSAFSIYAPVSGTVSQINESLSKDPGLVNRSPYEEGWIFVLEASSSSEAGNLMSSSRYEEFVKGEGH